MPPALEGKGRMAPDPQAELAGIPERVQADHAELMRVQERIQVQEAAIAVRAWPCRAR